MATYTVYTGVTSTKITVKQDESMVVLSRGIALSNTVNNGGLMAIKSGGVARSNTLNGHMQVMFGGIASTTTVNSGAYVEIFSGARALSTTVNNGAQMQIDFGGSAFNTTVNSGGQVDVEGVVFYSTVSSGGVIKILNCGSASGIKVNSGGQFYISSYGAFSGRMVLEAGAVVTASLNSIIDFDIFHWSPNDLIVNDLSLISGSPNYSLTIYDANYQKPGIYRLAGNAAGFNDKTITVKNTSGDEFGTFKVGGEKIVGDKIYTLSINTSSELIVTVTNLYDLTGYLEGKADLTSGMIASGVLIHSGGILNVLNGGYASMTRITNGSMHVSDGGFASMTSVDGGSMHVSSGGTADGVTVLHLGKLHVSAGGNVNTTTVSITGSMYVSDGGAASNTTVSSGGSHVYRNSELGMNIPVRIAPSGISADRARMLSEILNRTCADLHVISEA